MPQLIYKIVICSLLLLSFSMWFVYYFTLLYTPISTNLGVLLITVINYGLFAILMAADMFFFYKKGKLTHFYPIACAVMVVENAASLLRAIHSIIWQSNFGFPPTPLSIIFQILISLLPLIAFLIVSIFGFLKSNKKIYSVVALGIAIFFTSLHYVVNLLTVNQTPHDYIITFIKTYTLVFLIVNSSLTAVLLYDIKRIKSDDSSGEKIEDALEA